jgi:hypothetical protein
MVCTHQLAELSEPIEEVVLVSVFVFLYFFHSWSTEL